MWITVSYKSYDGVPYCAYTFIKGEYFCGISESSFEDAKQLLIEAVLHYKHRPVMRDSEEIEV